MNAYRKKSCSQCAKSFSSKMSLQAHFKLHSAEKPLPNPAFLEFMIIVIAEVCHTAVPSVQSCFVLLGPFRNM
jgi:hypothetical protein